MTTRRSFFRRLAAAIVCAPLIPKALAAVPAKPAIEITTLYHHMYDVMRARQGQQTIDIFTDRKTADMIRKSMVRYYESQWTEGLEESPNPMPTRAEVAAKVQPSRYQNLERWTELPQQQEGNRIRHKSVCVRSFGNRIGYASQPNGGCLWTLVP